MGWVESEQVRIRRRAASAHRATIAAADARVGEPEGGQSGTPAGSAARHGSWKASRDRRRFNGRDPVSPSIQMQSALFRRMVGCACLNVSARYATAPERDQNTSLDRCRQRHSPNFGGRCLAHPGKLPGSPLPGHQPCKRETSLLIQAGAV
jgi:hypothetical protein